MLRLSHISSVQQGNIGKAIWERAVRSIGKHIVWGVLALLGLAALAAQPARAQYFTNHDGYTDSGQARVQLEISPYLWLPATSGSIGFARQAVENNISGDFSTGIPSISQLASSLHFSFMGAGLLRYGAFSAEADLQYINAFGSKTLFTTPRGGLGRVRLNASYVRIAPGLGYQVYSGGVLGVPTSVDARAGFAYFEHWENLNGEGILTGRVSGNGDFIQPWLGTRVDFIPSPRWKIELAGLAQGFGIDGGSWGWGASAILSYAVSSWFDTDIGYRALRTQRFGAGRSLNLTAYGPVVGFSFRLGSSPPPPPAPTPAPVAAPAPAPAKTYLVFFDWDKADITPKAASIIAQAAADSKTESVTTIAVNGYTDTSGTPVYNQGLSERRAKAVAAQLVADGVAASEITARGFGDTDLLVPTGPGIREPQNRRVQIILQ
jgi:outer membrane protein OmpA-like peptidoglycan-associated protein